MGSVKRNTLILWLLLGQLFAVNAFESCTSLTDERTADSLPRLRDLEKANIEAADGWRSFLARSTDVRPHLNQKKILDLPASDASNILVGIKRYSNDSVRGINKLLDTRNNAALLAKLRAEFPDDVLDQAYDAIDKIQDVSKLSDEGARGVAVGQKAVKEGGDAADLIKTLIQKDVFQVDSARVDKAFKNVNGLEGVDGLDDYLKQLHDRATAIGVDGMIYEGKVAADIKKAAVPGSGSLVRVGLDTVTGVEKIDTLSSLWAIQVKHTKGSSFGLDNLDGGLDYLIKLKAQAAEFGETIQPVLIANKEFTKPLQDAAADLDILLVLVPD